MSSTPDTPQPVDPYTQAAAQYGLSTGTALFNAGLNRTNSVNPAGSSTWMTSQQGMSPSGQPSTSQPPVSPSGAVNGNLIASPTNPGTTNNFGVPYNNQAGMYPGGGGAGATINYGGAGGGSLGGGLAGTGLASLADPPTYTNVTSLQPWANQELSQPLDTSGIAGMPGGPSTTQDLAATRQSLYNQQMGYIQPQEQLAGEQLRSQLANEGITQGSEAYDNAIQQQNRANTFTNNQAINSAIAGGGAEQSRLFGLGTQSLQNQIAARAAPINEYNSLNGASGATANAQTPDISGAFGQQFQGQLAGYNANVASNNANTSAAGSLLASYLMYLALA